MTSLSSYKTATDGLVGRGVLLQDAYGTLIESVAALPRQSVVVAIGLSPYSRQTVDTAQRAVALGITVIALTDSELSPLARAASERLLFEAASPSFFHSLLGAHALVERVMAEIASRGGCGRRSAPWSSGEITAGRSPIAPSPRVSALRSSRSAPSSREKA